MTGLRVGVTGATGFCGGHAFRTLQAFALPAGAALDVLTLGRHPDSHRRFDLADAAVAPDLTGLDVVLHYAAAVGDPAHTPANSAKFRAANVDATARLLDAARAAGCRVVLISSASVYDPRPSRSFTSEDHPTAAGHLNLYASTKAAGDRLALEAGAVVLRPHAVYGPGDAHLLPRLRRLVRRLPGAGHVAVLPGPDVRLTVTHVATLTDAALHAAGVLQAGRRGEGGGAAGGGAAGGGAAGGWAAGGWAAGGYNVGDTAPTSRDALLRNLFAALGTPVVVRHAPPAAVRAVALAAEAVARRAGAEPLVSRYGLDQIGCDVVLDCSKATATGWCAPASVADYLTELRARR